MSTVPLRLPAHITDEDVRLICDLVMADAVKAGYDEGHKAGQAFTMRVHGIVAPDCDAFEVTPDLPTTERQS